MESLEDVFTPSRISFSKMNVLECVRALGDVPMYALEENSLYDIEESYSHDNFWLYAVSSFRLLRDFSIYRSYTGCSWAPSWMRVKKIMWKTKWIQKIQNIFIGL